MNGVGSVLSHCRWINCVFGQAASWGAEVLVVWIQHELLSPHCLFSRLCPDIRLHGMLMWCYNFALSRQFSAFFWFSLHWKWCYCACWCPAKGARHYGWWTYEILHGWTKTFVVGLVTYSKLQPQTSTKMNLNLNPFHRISRCAGEIPYTVCQ